MKAKTVTLVAVGLMLFGMAGANDADLLQKGITTLYSSAQPEGVQALLYTQDDNGGLNGVPSQYFIDFADGVAAADDFVVPAAGWDIEQIVINGVYSAGYSGAANTWDVVIYADAGGMPGASVFSQAGLTATLDTAGDITLDLAPAVSLTTGGTYWLSVVCNMNFASTDQWFWNSRTVQNGNPFHWQDPGNLFGLGTCPTWGPGATVCIVGSSDEPDLLFTLNGTVLPVELQSMTIE